MSVQGVPWQRPLTAERCGANDAARPKDAGHAARMPSTAPRPRHAATAMRDSSPPPTATHRDAALPRRASWPWAAATLLVHGVLLVAVSQTWSHKAPAPHLKARPDAMQWVAVRPISLHAPHSSRQPLPPPPAPRVVLPTTPELPIPTLTLSDPQRSPLEPESLSQQSQRSQQTAQNASAQGPEDRVRPFGIEGAVAAVSTATGSATSIAAAEVAWTEGAARSALHADGAKASGATPPRPDARSALPDASPQPASFPAHHQQCQDSQTARFYPALLRDRGVQGLVRLRVKVDDNGRAAEVLIADGSGFRLLDEAARRVAAACPYVPARQGGQPVSSWIEYAVRFALSPPSSAL